MNHHSTDEILAASVSRRQFIGAMGALAIPSPAFGQEQGSRVELLAMGDWGAPTTVGGDHTSHDVKTLRGYQDEVANAMAEYARAQAAKNQSISAVLALGDNFYGALSGPHDERFKDRFEKLYSAEDLKVPFHFIIGNHDYEDKPVNNFRHQIAYARNNAGTRWHWPAKDDLTWYTTDFPEHEPLLTAVSLNTNTELADKPMDWAAQVEFLRSSLSNAQGRWRIVIAHHPMWTDGTHYPDSIGKGHIDTHLYARMHSTILPELKNVVFYVSGHDHNLQSIKHSQHPDTHFFISGAGGGDYPTRHPRRPVTDKVDYTSEFHGTLGFLHLSFTMQEARARFIGKDTSTGAWGVLGQEVSHQAA